MRASGRPRTGARVLWCGCVLLRPGARSPGRMSVYALMRLCAGTGLGTGSSLVRCFRYRSGFSDLGVGDGFWARWAALISSGVGGTRANHS